MHKLVNSIKQEQCVARRLFRLFQHLLVMGHLLSAMLAILDILVMFTATHNHARIPAILAKVHVRLLEAQPAILVQVSAV